MKTQNSTLTLAYQVSHSGLLLGFGEEKYSKGSDLILEVLDEEDEPSLWVLVWGGLDP